MFDHSDPVTLLEPKLVCKSKRTNMLIFDADIVLVILNILKQTTLIIGEDK